MRSRSFAVVLVSLTEGDEKATMEVIFCPFFDVVATVESSEWKRKFSISKRSYPHEPSQHPSRLATIKTRERTH